MTLLYTQESYGKNHKPLPTAVVYYAEIYTSYNLSYALLKQKRILA